MAHSDPPVHDLDEPGAFARGRAHPGVGPPAPCDAAQPSPSVWTDADAASRLGHVGRLWRVSLRFERRLGGFHAGLSVCRSDGGWNLPSLLSHAASGYADAVAEPRAQRTGCAVRWRAALPAHRPYGP